MTQTFITSSPVVDEQDGPGPGPGAREPETVRAWRVGAGGELGGQVRDRGFLLSTLVTLAIILGAIGAQAYLGAHADEVTVAVAGADATTLVESADALADQSGESVDLHAQDEPSVAGVEDAVRSGAADVGLVSTADGWRLVGKTDPNAAAATWIGAAVQLAALEQNAGAAGLTVAELTEGSAVDQVLLEPDETPDLVVRISTYVFGFLFYLAAVLLGVSLATSIVEEKQNRIVEIIASSTSLRQLLVGKIVGNTTLALGQMLAFSVVGVAGLVAMGRTETLRQVTGGLGWFLVFYGVGIAVLACVFAAAGALATRSEDIQSTTTPVSAAVAVIFVAGISASGAFQTVLSFLPLSSTITMPARVVSGDVMWWEPVLSLLVAAATAVAVVAASERIYRRALMQTGSRLSFRQAFRLED